MSSSTQRLAGFDNSCRQFLTGSSYLDKAGALLTAAEEESASISQARLVKHSRSRPLKQPGCLL